MSEKDKLETLYRYSVSVDFDYYKTTTMCESLNLNSMYYYDYIKEYLNEYSNFFEEDILNILIEIRNKRKKIEIINTVGNNFILEEVLGIKIDKLYTNLEEKMIVAKYIYEYSYIREDMEKGIDTLAKQLGVPKFVIKSLYSYYERTLKSKDLKVIDNKETLVTKTFLKLVRAKTLVEIIEIIKGSNIKVSYLKENILAFSSKYGNKLDVIYDNLTKKLDAYMEYITKQNQNKREEMKNEENKILLEEAKVIIQDFLKGDLKIEEFCKSMKITTSKFNRYIELLKRFEPKIYEEYRKKNEETSLKYYRILGSIIKEIIENIKTNPNFTVVDVFSITTVPFKVLIEIGEREVKNKNLSVEDMKIFRYFIRKNEEATKLDKLFKKRILSSVDRINVEFDEEGKILPGSGEIIAIETKEIVLNYLKTHNIPINSYTYDIILKRYLNNELNVVENEELKR